MPHLIVIGSINQDSFAFVESFPRPGETVLARSASVGLGGKGCNQAMAASLAGAQVSFVGAVGTDSAGDFALSTLASGGIDVAAIARVDAVGTGAAYISVDHGGENTIIVASGANASVTGETASAALVPLLDALERPVLLVQGELPADVVVAIADLARGRRLRLVVNLAPVSVRDAAALSVANPLIVNETEAADLLGREAEPAVAAAELRSRYSTDVVVTVGAQGAVVADADGVWRQPSPVPPAVVDTTGAGDAFVGVLAAALCSGLPLAEAARRAVAAASHSVSGRGTVTSYAAVDELDALLAGVPEAVPS